MYDVLVKFRHLSMKRDDNTSFLRNSYRRCLAVNKEFINEFYTLFLNDMPQGDRDHFTNRERQHTMLQMAMDVLIDLDQKEDLFRNILENGKHQRFDVAAYERFMDVFIGLAQKTDHKKWDEATEKAWMEMRDKALAVVRKVLKG